MSITRRRFLSSSAATAAVGVASPAVLSAASRARIVGANDQLRVAVVGLRGRGRSHIRGFQKLKGCSVVALCDVDTRFTDREAAELAKAGVEGVRKEVDYRRLLESKDVDVLSVATPNHWHSLMGIHACQAGKDVYLEKPVSHNVFEGRQLVEATRKYRRVVASGTQSRSNPGMQAAIEYVQSGELGKIQVARGLCYKRRGSIGKVQKPTPIPATVDYDLWTGPAPLTELNRKNLHYDWHWVWATGNGDLGNQGIHQMDLCRWALGEKTLPSRVQAFGGRVGYDDDGETPNTMVVQLDYESAPLVFEVRGLPEGKGQKKMDRYRGASIGIVIECEKGYLVMHSYSAGAAYRPDGELIRKFKGGGNHFANFEGAVRARDPEQLNAEIEEGHVSSALCHVGNIALLCGEPRPVTELSKTLSGELAKALGRTKAHLKKNGLDPEKTELQHGRSYDIHDESVRDPVIHRHWSREYRKPFVVPEKI